jgi:hypothetical protein
MKFFAIALLVDEKRLLSQFSRGMVIPVGAMILFILLA